MLLAGRAFGARRNRSARRAVRSAGATRAVRGGRPAPASRSTHAAPSGSSRAPSAPSSARAGSSLATPSARQRPGSGPAPALRARRLPRPRLPPPRAGIGSRRHGGRHRRGARAGQRRARGRAVRRRRSRGWRPAPRGDGASRQRRAPRVARGALPRRGDGDGDACVRPGPRGRRRATARALRRPDAGRVGPHRRRSRRTPGALLAEAVLADPALRARVDRRRTRRCSIALRFSPAPCPSSTCPPTGRAGRRCRPRLRRRPPRAWRSCAAPTSAADAAGRPHARAAQPRSTARRRPRSACPPAARRRRVRGRSARRRSPHVSRSCSACGDAAAGGWPRPVGAPAPGAEPAPRAGDGRSRELLAHDVLRGPQAAPRPLSETRLAGRSVVGHAGVAPGPASTTSRTRASISSSACTQPARASW